MLNRDDVKETVSVDLLKRGYSIFEKPKGRRKGADIIAREPESKRRLLISVAGRPRSKSAKNGDHRPRTESQVLECMMRSVYSALRMQKENEFGPGDQMAIAFPDLPENHKYLTVQKPVFDSLGVKIILVNKDRQVRML